MKILLKRPSNKNTRNVFRELGYYFFKQDLNTREFVFFRPARGYPRFHIYLKEEGENLIINLHLDQKKPVYSNTHAHQAEYDSEVVKAEAERIKASVL